MRRVLQRTAGYLLPTLVVVTGLHLVREATAGEALDGVVSGMWFVVLFFAGASLTARSGADEHPAAAPAREGLLIGVLNWLALWAFWNVPQTEALRASAGTVFLINSVTSLAAGVVRLPRTRPDRALTI
jgi:hypothetical protein